MERLILSNLRKLQAFDSNLKAGSAIDRIADSYLKTVLFESNDQARAQHIGALQLELLDHFKIDVLPKSERLGAAAAATVAKKTLPPELPNIREIRRELADLRARPNQRIEIVRSILDDKGNTLNNRLYQFWHEPMPGGDTARIKRLAQIQRDLDKRRDAYEEKLRAFRTGELKVRPARPQLDLMARFTHESKEGMRTQARRAGGDAETAHFLQLGYQEFIWVTVQATDACPDCRKRSGVVGDVKFWNEKGRPGAGTTVCGNSCYCMLIPKDSLKNAPKLAAHPVIDVRPIQTSQADVKEFDQRRIGGVTVSKNRTTFIPQKASEVVRQKSRITEPKPSLTVKASPAPIPEKRPAAAVKLSQKEIDAVSDYTTDSFQQINSYLRNGGSQQKDLNTIISRVDSALEKLPKFDGTTYRAFTVPADQFDDLSTQLSVGRTYVDKAYMSASDRPRGFQAVGNNVISMEIRGGNGADISKISLNPGEREVLYRRGQEFIVESAIRGETGELRIVLVPAKPKPNP